VICVELHVCAMATRYRDGDLRSLYKSLALEFRVWIYNGQEDGCIPYTGAEEWTSHLGYVAK
jgi:hypothetical protein